MFRLLKFLFTGSWHEHKWETIDKKKVKYERGDVTTRFYLRCTECGTITTEEG